MYIHHITLCNHHDECFSLERQNGYIDFLYLIIKSPCALMMRTEFFTVNVPSAVLLSPNTPHKYTALGDHYEDDYLHFATDDNKAFIGELTFPLNTPVALTDYTSISDILEIIQKEYEVRHEDAQSKKAMLLLIQYLMLETGRQWNAKNTKNNETPHYDALLEIRSSIFENPKRPWSINELADQAHLSPAYFQVLYRRAFGSTCINDVIHARVSLAKELLISTSYSVGEISKLVGYNEVYHFIRQFKKSTGVSPGAFRKKV